MRSIEQLLKDAELIAIRVHGDQTYDEVFPYERHLRDVVGVAERFDLDYIIIIACWLHDAIEDGDLSYKDIKNFFTEEIAEIVFCVTDELGRNRKERKQKTYPKIRANAKAIETKLCDRIANVEHGLRMNSPQSKMYAKEYAQFKAELYSESMAKSSPGMLRMWNHLDSILLVTPE